MERCINSHDLVINVQLGYKINGLTSTKISINFLNEVVIGKQLFTISLNFSNPFLSYTMRYFIPCQMVLPQTLETVCGAELNSWFKVLTF